MTTYQPPANPESSAEPTLRDVIVKLDHLATNVDKLTTDVDIFKTDVNTLKTDVNTLKTDVNTLKTDVNILKTDVDTLTTDVERFNDRFSNYQQATRWVVQLAFTLIASATITVIITAILKR